MHRIDTPTAVKDKFGPGKNGFTDGNIRTGRHATWLNSAMWDALQEEICGVIEKAGIELNKEEHDQLYKAI
ncbi:phage tail protein, partial [Escherichia coli]|nr:phage tail protein [Escherichia coli]